MEVEVQGLTPYQGTRRCFGLFKCEDCSNTWSSASSWRDTWQRCRDCGGETYPFTQRRLRKKDDGDDDENAGPERAHAQLMCGMCQRLGVNCMELDHSDFNCEHCQCSWRSKQPSPQRCRGCDALVKKVDDESDCDEYESDCDGDDDDDVEDVEEQGASYSSGEDFDAYDDSAEEESIGQFSRVGRRQRRQRYPRTVRRPDYPA